MFHYMKQRRMIILEKICSFYTFEKLSCSKYHFWENRPLDILTSIIPHAVNVQKICVPHNCNDNLLKSIASACSHLTELNIRGSPVTDQGLTALCRSSENHTQITCKLIYLDMSNVPVTMKGVMNILRKIPTLQELIFEKVPSALYSIHEVDIDNNSLSRAKKYNLKALDFTKYCKDSSLLLTLLKMCAELCPFVKKLVVPNIVQECMDICLLFSHLESLTLKKHKYMFSHKIDFNNFLSQNGKNLKSLSVEYCSLSVPNIVENCTNLESLRLYNVKLEHKDIKSSNILKKLKELEIDISVTDSVIALLDASPNVETLHLHNYEFEESTLLGNLSRFAFSTSLKHLHIYLSDLKVDLLQEIIFKCCFLETLFLYDCKNISYSDVGPIEEFIKTSNRNIEFSRHISVLNGNYISDSEIADLCAL